MVFAISQEPSQETSGAGLYVYHIALLRDKWQRVALKGTVLHRSPVCFGLIESMPLEVFEHIVVSPEGD